MVRTHLVARSLEEVIHLTRITCPQTKTAGSSTRPFKTLSAYSAFAARAQLAFFTNTGLPTFFSIARFRSSARGDSTSALALIR
ncbi:hypothetical protein ACVIGB_005953 [Bradyrhizobium sp. USDA 4341]